MNYVISITTVIFICLIIKKIFFKGKEKQQTNIEDGIENEDFVLQYFDQFTLNEVLSGKNSAASKKHKLNRFQLGNKTLIWDFDEDESCVGNLPSDNLYIENLWHMKDTVGEGQLCTGVNIIDDQNFSFSTWECFCYFMHIENDEVTLIERVFTK